MQNLLIDTEGRIVPSPLIQDVQIRRFTHDEKGKAVKTELREYELSRKALLTNPSGDGFLTGRLGNGRVNNLWLLRQNIVDAA